MIASLPQIVARLTEPVKVMPGLPGPAVTRQLPPLRIDPGTPPPHLSGLLSTPVAKTDAAPPSKATSFSRAWAAALEHIESATAERLKSTRGLSLPLSGPKPTPQSRTHDNVTPGIFANEKTSDKTEPLPLVLSLAAPQPSPAELKNSSNVIDVANQTPTNSDTPSRPAPQTNLASQITSAPQPEGEEEKQSLPGAVGGVAFTAKFKSPAPVVSVQPAAAISSAAAASSLVPKSSGVLQMVDSAAIAKPVIAAPADVSPSSTTLSAAAGELSPSSIQISSPFRSEPIDPAAGSTVSAPQPMKEIAFQLPGARGVEVRLTEVGGEIRMDVHTGNTALTQDLRGNLHDLVSGLERKGISAEVTHPPDHATTPTARSADTGAFKDQTPGGGQGGAFDRQPQQRNRQPGQAPEPPTSKARSTAWNDQAISSFGKENK